MKVRAKQDIKVWFANATAYYINKNDELDVVGTYLDNGELVYVVHAKRNTSPFAVMAHLIV